MNLELSTQSTLFVSHVSLVCYAPCVEMKSKREAAELLCLSTRGIERAVRRGQLTVVYRDSKHGKTAWFSPPELEQYKQLQQARGPVGFTSGIPPQPVVGTLVPVVEMGPRRKAAQKQEANTVPIAERLTLNVEEAAHLSGLPRSFIVKNIHSGKLRAVRIGRSYHVKRLELDRFVRAL
jgi:excisionase family DNA binding protein